VRTFAETSLPSAAPQSGNFCRSERRAAWCRRCELSVMASLACTSKNRARRWRSACLHAVFGESAVTTRPGAREQHRARNAFRGASPWCGLFVQQRPNACTASRRHALIPSPARQCDPWRRRSHGRRRARAGRPAAAAPRRATRVAGRGALARRCGARRWRRPRRRPGSAPVVARDRGGALRARGVGRVRQHVTGGAARAGGA